jgi:3-hydroxy-9,10-secoandrosta-1,3,5(10)-triene-9,17-dione monooxygenase reductase component
VATEGVTGAPLITGALAHIECALAAAHDAANHVIAVGRVVALRENGADEHPLLYYRGEYRSLRKESLATSPCGGTPMPDVRRPMHHL